MKTEQPMTSFRAQRSAKRFALLVGILSLALVGIGNRANARPTVLLVIGAPGEPEYASNFLHQATLWQNACAQGDCHCVVVGLETNAAQNDLSRVKQALESEPKDSVEPLWLVLIGHGTYDGKQARFNLQGPDLSAADLAGWLKPFHRALAIIDTSSCSAPFLAELSGTNRVVVTATRSGHEQSFARFGQYLAEALTDSQADLDKDGQVSLLEAFLAASRQAAEFYKVEGRLATEHALLDDNGDGLGTPADWFRGLRAVRSPKQGAALDGALARQFHLVPSVEERALSPEQRTERDSLERAVFQLREKKPTLAEDEYYTRLEGLLLKLARLSETNAAPTRPD